jgi:cytochrome c-type biogenesis protein CcmH/NrfF
MRDLVTQRVRKGKTNAEIEAEFRASYGEWIFLSPPVASWSGLIWLVPIVAVAAGLVLVTGRLRGGDTPGPLEASAMQVAALRERVAREEAAEG